MVNAVCAARVQMPGRPIFSQHTSGWQIILANYFSHLENVTFTLRMDANNNNNYQNIHLRISIKLEYLIIA